MAKNEKIATGVLNRNRILKENKQSWVQLKLLSNSKNLDLKKIYIERFKSIGFSTYVTVNHKIEIKRSNITEIARSDGTILWRKKDNKLKKLKRKIMGQTIENYEGKNVSLIYDGSDLTDGQVGPQELTGFLKRVGKHTSELETTKETFKLMTREIQIKTIKIIK